MLKKYNPYLSRLTRYIYTTNLIYIMYLKGRVEGVITYANALLVLEF